MKDGELNLELVCEDCEKRLEVRLEALGDFPSKLFDFKGYVEPCDCVKQPAITLVINESEKAEMIV